MAQLVWYIAQTIDTGNIKKLVESYHVMGKGGWVSDYGPIYPAGVGSRLSISRSSIFQG